MQEQSKQIVEVQLRHMALEPESLKCQINCNILVRVTNNNSCSFQSRDRKFLFLLEETDEESPPLTEGQEYYFQKALEEPGTYSLQCLNYTKIRCSIEVQKEESEKSEKECEQEVVELVRAPSPLCDLTQVTEQRDEEIKDTNEGMLEQENKNNSKSEFADYERILSDEDMQYDYMPNKYLKYFKEEFKLWRDFFDQPAETAKHSSSRKEPSSGSLSLSERESEKEESVISHLRSQQEMSQVQQEELNRSKIMKKTNSEYCFNVDRQTEKNHPSDSKRKQINTNTSSPNPRTEQSQADSFVDWAWSWADGQKLGQVKIERMGDRHLVRQWLTFLQNKFKISEIMYG